MSDWWGGKKVNLNYWSYYWILDCERNLVRRIEEKRRWVPLPVLIEGINVGGRGADAHYAEAARRQRSS